MDADYLSPEELAGNRLLGAVLVSRRCRIGRGNLLYPGVVLECGPDGALAIGDDNVFWPGTMIGAGSGSVVIGSRNQFGPGGLTVALEATGQRVEIGSAGRYREGAVLLAGALLGDGSQVLGAIQVQDCRLGAGGSHATPDAAERGGVLKGCGRARGLTVGRGEVILGEGRFAQADVVSQTVFHPPAR